MSKDSPRNPELLSEIFKLGYALPFPASEPDNPASLHPELSGHFNVNMRSLEDMGANLGDDSGQMCAYMAGVFTRLAVVSTVTFVAAVGAVQGMNYLMDKDHKNPETPTATAPATPAPVPQLTRK